jgi:FAD/FMN-containing dehydrogenase
MTVQSEPLAEVGGAVIRPSDPAYDSARRVFRGEVDKHPAVIVQVADVDDIRRVIEMARQTGMDLAVRSGGHSAGGWSTTDGGIVLDVRRLKSLDFDDADSTVWAGAGLTALEVTQAAWERKLLIGFGDTGSVGIAGLTLGGGIGYAVRKYGLTIDNLLAVEIVTADGKVLTADDATNRDLFWALRGGGGNLGVATRFKFQLHPVEAFVGGMLMLPATVETIVGFIEAAESAPEEVSTIANVMNAPPMPGVPDDVVGKPVIFGLLAHFGSTEAGLEAMEPFRALAKPYADMLAEQPYPQIYGPEDDSYRPKAADHTLFLDHIGPEEAHKMLAAIESSDSSLRAVQLRVLGGAMARVPVDATAFAHRRAPIMAVVVNFFDGPDDLPKREAWTASLAAELDQGVPGAYVNFLRDEGNGRIREAYPGATFDRLAGIKKRYDPENQFRLNQNIPPAG